MFEFKIPYKKNYFHAYGINYELNQPAIYFSHANGFNGLAYKTLLNKKLFPMTYVAMVNLLFQLNQKN
jgi:hypothetical protein